MPVVTSVAVASVWVGDNRATRGRRVRVTDVHQGVTFDPYLSVEVESDDDPSEVGQRRYSRASWLQQFYRPS